MATTAAVPKEEEATVNNTRSETNEENEKSVQAVAEVDESDAQNNAIKAIEWTDVVRKGKRKKCADNDEV